jgi:Amidohydrolase/Starch/carbohydrate-binding module (family 53)
MMTARPISWAPSRNGAPSRQVAYRGPLAGSRLRLHYGFDGWQGPARDARLEVVESGLAVAEIPDLDGHVSLDCVVTDGEKWDNNDEADYRLWIGLDPIDSHLHLSGRGRGELGLVSLRTAMLSAGMGAGIVSWMENEPLDEIDAARAGLHRLVWVRPGDTTRAEVRARLAAGYVGLKLHPTFDGYQADDEVLNPYIEIAGRAGCPVACHSAPGDADPDFIRRLAERFPEVPFILYHTYLGPHEGRRRASRHVREQPNLYLETSWCRWQEVLRSVREAGADRVMFGSDASVDGPRHYRRQPPNVEGKETYNAGLISLVRELGPGPARQVMGDNARRLFELPGA